jgi:uncharacterized protein YgiM (DUF1202 family)
MLSSVQRARSECVRPGKDDIRRGPVRVACVLLLVALFALIAAPRNTYAEGGSYVDTDRLNLRSDPGTYGAVIGKLFQGDPIEVLAGPTEDGWYEVNYYGSVGWVYGGYIIIGGSPGWENWEGSSVGSSGPSVWVATDVLNIRADATTHSEVLNRAWQGAELTVVGEGYNGFIPVVYDGVQGWANAAYLAWEPSGSGSTGSSDKWIDVNRTTHTVTLYEGNDKIASYWAAMGFEDNSYGFYATAVGTYYVYNKNPELFYTSYAKAYFKYWVGFDPERENGFHSYTMDSDGNVLADGSGPTGGCVATEPDAAAHIFDFADIGTRVEVHW